MPSTRRFFSVAALVLVACGGKTEDVDVADTSTSDTSPTDTGPSADSVGDVVIPPTDAPPGSSARPPPRPSSSSTGTTKWFVIDRLRVGITTAAGAASPSAWKDYGDDLGARTTTADDSPTSKNSCKRRSGSPTKVLADGNDGRDDNFGQHVMAVVKSLVSDVEDKVNAEILAGNSTLLLRLDNVAGDDNAVVPGALFVAASLGSKPTFAESEKWPIDFVSIDGSKEAKLLFSKGYMSGGVWVSGELGTTTAQIMLPLVGVISTLSLESAVITVRVKDGTGGVIAGASDTTKAKDALTPPLKLLGICPGNATYDQVVETLTQSADLVSGAPSLQDMTRECNALSMAFAFTMKPTTAPDARTSGLPPPADSCK